MSPHILLVYGSSYGHTARIADRISSTLLEAGCSVTLIAGNQLPDLLLLDSFDGVIIAASVIRSRHQRYVEEFVRKNLIALNRIPGAFFSVSLIAAGSQPDAAAAARADVAAFLKRTGWRPHRTFTVAGELAYSRYNPILRFVMKRISRKEGLATDTSRDHDYTDWQQVSHSAKNFAAFVTEKHTAAAGPKQNQPAMHPLR